MAILDHPAATLKRHGPALTTAVMLHVAAAAAIHAGMRDVEPPRREEVRKVVAELITLPRRIEPQPAVVPQKAATAPSKPRQQAAAQPVPHPQVAAAASNALTDAPTSAATPASQSAPVSAPSAPVAQQAPVAVTAPRFDAAYLNNPKPAYPNAARRLGEEGTVLLHVRVSAEGLPVKIEVRDSSGSERLDDAARAAVAQWRFVPAKQGDEAVAAWVLVPLVFRMNG